MPGPGAKRTNETFVVGKTHFCGNLLDGLVRFVQQGQREVAPHLLELVRLLGRVRVVEAHDHLAVVLAGKVLRAVR